MAIKYYEFLVLGGVNYWPDEGQPEEGFVYFVVSSTEGDPRGNISIEDAKKTFDELLEKKWIVIGPSSDGSKRAFVYPSKEGRSIFKENLGYWMDQAEISRKKR